MKSQKEQTQNFLKKVSSNFTRTLFLAAVVSGCSTPPVENREPAFARARTGLDKGGYASLLKKFGLKTYYANLHAHHFMSDDENVPTECEGNHPQDDGRPCRNNSENINTVVTQPNQNPRFEVINYFKEACRYAANEGQLNVLWVTPHSKNNGVQNQSGQKPDTDTLLAGYDSRHRLLGEVNSQNNKSGKFYCGLGQEASSISAGNHINIFGQFKINSRDTHPLFFQTGDFSKLFSELRDRRTKGEKIVLQMNHPESNQDIWWKPLSEAGKKLKEALNDYGLDDFAPVGCMVKRARSMPLPSGCSEAEAQPDLITTELLKKTYANIREAGGDPFRMIEVISPSAVGPDDKRLGATTNPTTQFLKVHGRRDPLDFVDGLRDYVFYLTMGFKLSPTANQDNHHMNFGSATASRTGILARSVDEADLIDAFDGRRTFATEDMNASAVLAIEDHLMGDEVQVAQDNVILSIGYRDLDSSEKTANIRAFIYHENDNPNFSHNSKDEEWAQVYASVATVESGSATLMRIQGLKKGRQFVFLELTQADNDKIVTAPIWVTVK